MRPAVVPFTKNIPLDVIWVVKLITYVALLRISSGHSLQMRDLAVSRSMLMIFSTIHCEVGTLKIGQLGLTSLLSSRYIMLNAFASCCNITINHALKLCQNQILEHTYTFPWPSQPLGATKRSQATMYSQSQLDWMMFRPSLRLQIVYETKQNLGEKMANPPRGG